MAQEDTTPKSGSEKTEKAEAPKPGREHMHSVRSRLYDRGLSPRQNKRTSLQRTSQVEDAPHAWGNTPLTIDPNDVDMARKQKKKYRFVLVVFSLFFFVAALLLSSAYMFLGGNTISNENISVAISGPVSIGGGEEVSLQIGVSNQNNVALHSATLHVRFPVGSQSIDGEQTELLRESIPLETIDPGQTINVPIKFALYGEEDEEKQVVAEIEYRLQGSNGTFEEQAEPYLVKINSSPATIAVEGPTTVSSGQPVDLELQIRSNASSILRDLVVRTEYPFGYDYTNASPEPLSGENVWVIDELEPGETYTITVSGVVTGVPQDERIVRASVGVSSDRSTYELASVFSTSDIEYDIERDFVNLAVTVNNSAADTVVVGKNNTAAVRISFTNPLDTKLYDAEVTAELAGTALDESGVDVSRGFYDSIKNAVIFDYNTLRNLEEIDPGETVQMEFDISADDLVRQTPEINMVFNVRARRVQESSAQESLVADIQRTIRYASTANLLTSVTYQSGVLPPVAEKLTQYTVAIRVESGSNDLVDAEVTTELPNYVTWLDLSSGDGNVSFNPSARTVLWKAGDIDDNDEATMTFTVALLPSISQVGSEPTLVSNQTLQATDRFTGTVVRDTMPALSTELSREAGYDKADGVVRRTEDD